MSEALVDCTDFFATIADLAEVELPADTPLPFSPRSQSAFRLQEAASPAPRP